MQAMDRTFASGEFVIRYTDTPGARDTTYFLVHGIGMGRVVYSGVSEELAGSGRVIAVDLPGFGDSPEPGSEHSLEVTAAVLAKCIVELSTGPVVLVGHSMGTQIVAEVAANAPGLVSHLVLIAPTVNRYERRASTQALRMVQDLVGEGPKVLFLGMWEYAKTSPRWFVSKLRFMLDHKIELLCPRISVPTLVLRGETDRVCPRQWVQEVTDALPRAEMREIQGRGHEAIIKSSEPVASLICEFVARG